jgi:hypothetical protein
MALKRVGVDLEKNSYLPAGENGMGEERGRTAIAT